MTIAPTTAISPEMPAAAASPTMSTCRFCWQPIIAGGPGAPAYLHTATRRAGCTGGLPIAEPVPACAPPVQGALFDLPPASRSRRPAFLPLAVTVWPGRGGPVPTPHGSGGGLAGTFVHALVGSLGWHAGASIAHMLGSWLVLIALVVGVLYLVGRRRWRR